LPGLPLCAQSDLTGAAFAWRLAHPASAPWHPPELTTLAVVTPPGKIFAGGLLGAASQTRNKYDDQRQKLRRGVLTHDAREKAEAEVMGDLLNIGRQEAALVWRGQSEGLPVEHRSDCHPRDPAMQACHGCGAASPGSSLRMLWDMRR